MPLILPGNVATATASTTFSVANSCRFNSGDSPSLKDGDGSAPAGNRQKFTFSIWFKRAKLGATQMLASAAYSSGDEGYLYISSGDTLEWDSTNSGDGDMFSSMKLRDTSAWYHLVWSVDTTQSTAGNRMKFYLNGTQMTSWSTETQPNQNQNLYWNVGGTYYPYIGRRHGGDYWDGYLAEIVHIDNAQLAATSFGEFDEDSPTIWKPKDVSGLTFGTAGYHLDFEDSGELGKDVSGQGNHFGTVANLAATDQATDSCTNNFATLNPLENYHAGGTFTQGNTYYTSVSSKHDFAVSTIGMTAGKWYAEFKVHQDTDYNAIGISDHSYQGSNQEISEDNYSYAFVNYDASNSIVRGNGSTILSSMPLFGNGDIVCVAVDITNSKLYFRKNGDAWINSGDPTSGSTGTGAVSIQDLSSVSSSYGQGVYFFGVGLWNTSAAGSYDANFGNPAFAISSGNSDANGYGNFEYSVPSGYLSLCTKNLGSDGG